ncbi:MAG: phosphatidate cytidylyltransferase [Crocinitomicaceae bacterium]|nr:phosphatidate cytidylyltransferase [Crocinitomicaceae bacterium]MBK8925227.1 phosphatidate cytidylyltransferase [Crocinitomicaceae bacterium]
MSNFLQRAITGTLFVIVLIGAILLGGWYMHGLFGLIVVLGLWEFFSLFKATDIKPQKILGTFIGTAIYFLVLLSWYFGEIMMVPLIGLLFLFFMVTAISELFRKTTRPFENVSITLVATLYIVLPFVLLNVYSFEHVLEVETLIWPPLSIFILIWCNDTFAYLTGRLLGKHKLFERISPKKTWEGFIGGVAFAVLAGILLAYFLEWSYSKMITYGIVVGVIGTAGDLVESMLKRNVGVKDSGTILPGHGGILDRFDAVLFVVPVIFFLEKFIFVIH